MLEEELMKLQELAESTNDATYAQKNNLLSDMLGCTILGVIIRSRFQSAELMDAPSKFLFSLEKQNGLKKALQLEEGILLTNPSDI